LIIIIVMVVIRSRMDLGGYIGTYTFDYWFGSFDSHGVVVVVSSLFRSMINVSVYL